METTGPAAAAATDLAGTVLCIEDDPVSMQLIEGLLEAYPSITLLKATTGVEGVALALSVRPALVLLDMHLPDMRGLDVVRALNEAIAQGAFHLVLLTAEPFSIEVAKAMSLGARAHWQKPLDPARLASGLMRVLGGQGRERPR